MFGMQKNSNRPRPNSHKIFLYEVMVIFSIDRRLFFSRSWINEILLFSCLLFVITKKYFDPPNSNFYWTANKYTNGFQTSHVSDKILQNSGFRNMGASIFNNYVFPSTDFLSSSESLYQSKLPHRIINQLWKILTSWSNTFPRDSLVLRASWSFRGKIFRSD